MASLPNPSAPGNASGVAARDSTREGCSEIADYVEQSINICVSHNAIANIDY